MEPFYSRLSYSFGNEDWVTEHQALKIKSTDKVVCVTASGDRPLNLLTADCKEIVAIDANPMQNALFDLKKTAIANLPYDQYLSFLGVRKHPNRFDTYKRKIEQDLHPQAAKLLVPYSEHIQKGILYQGALEKWLKLTSKILRPVRGKKIDTLFSFNEIEQQAHYVKKEWQTFLWKKGMEFAVNPLFSRFLIRDPGLYAYVDPKLHVGKYLHTKMNEFLHRYLAKESVLMSLIFKGEVHPNYLPPYLCADGFEVIKKRLGRIRYETKSLMQYLEETPKNSFDTFSISDVASYISPADFLRLVKGVQKTARSNARFCFRQFLSNHQIPKEFSLSFIREPDLEKKLEKEDRCFVYQFMVGTIKK